MSKPVTIERIDAALDKLAYYHGIMELPQEREAIEIIFARLERDRAELAGTLSRIQERARKATRPTQSARVSRDAPLP